MFSIQLCVCFYMILSVCHCHFGSKVYENCTKRIILADKVNFTKKNDTTNEYLAKDLSNIHIGINRKHGNDFSRTVTEIDKSKDKIHNGVIKKNVHILGVNLTLPDSEITDKQQIVTEKINNTDEYIENIIDSNNQSESIKDTEAFSVTKTDVVEGQSTVVKKVSITENEIDFFPKIKFDNAIPKYELPENSENYDLPRQVKNEYIVKTVTKNIRNYSMDENDQKDDLSKKVKNVNIHKSVKNKTMINSTKIFQNNRMDENILIDLPKNVQKRDIGKSDNVPNDIMPKKYQNYYGKNYQKYDNINRYEKYHTEKDTRNVDTMKTMQNYDKQKKIHNINDYKPYKYQNYEMNYKKIIDKNDVETDKHTKRLDDHISHHAIPQIQTRLNNDLIKKSLDEFKMVRRKTHYTLPQIDVKNVNPKRDADRYQDLTYFNEYNDKARQNGARNHDDAHYHQYPNYGEKNDQSYEEPNMPHFKKLNDILARQKEIVQKLSQIQLIARQQPEPEFDAILTEVEAKKKKKGYSKLSFTTIPLKIIKTTMTSTKEPTTVMTQFDEIEIRKALKNDPHVNRILKMANLKREKYLDNVRSYLVRNNYVHEKGNAWHVTANSSKVNRAKAVEN